MLDPHHLRTVFARDGVVHLPGFLAENEVDELESQLGRYIREVVPHLPKADAFCEHAGDWSSLKQMQRIEQHDTWFADWAQREKFKALADALLGTPARSQGVEWFNKPARTGRPTPPHQDGFYFCLTPDEAVTAWIALEDVDEENGCLHYALGSHAGGIRPHHVSEVLGFSQTVDQFDPAQCETDWAAVLRRGDLVAHHSATIHWAGPNRSDRSRRSLALVSFSQRARRDEAAFQRYLDSSRQQQSQMGAV